MPSQQQEQVQPAKAADSREGIARIAAIVAAVATGSTTVMTKAVVQQIPPINLTFLRYGLGTMFLLSFVWASGASVSETMRIQKRDLPLLILVAAVSFCYWPVALSAALQTIPASRAGVLMGTTPLWAALIGIATRRDRLTMTQISGLLVGFAGIVWLAVPNLESLSEGGSLRGNLLALSAAASMAVAGILQKVALARHRAITLTVYRTAIAALVLFLIALASNASCSHGSLPSLSGRELLYVAGIGLFSGALVPFLWAFAIHHLSPTQVMAFTNLNPVVAPVLAVLLLGETLGARFLAAGVVIIGGIVLSQARKRRAPG